MGQWSDRIQNHQIWQHLQALGPVIDQAIKREAIEPSDLDGLERLRAVLALAGKRLAGADPATTLPGPLDGISTGFQNAMGEVQAFVNDGATGHISNANAHADTALTHLSQVSVPFTREELAALKDAATSYRSSLEHLLQQARATSDSLRSETDANRAKLAELSGDIQAERQRLAQVTSDYQAHFSTAQETRSREFSEAQTARQDKFAGVLADYTQRLTEQNADFTREKESTVRQFQEAIDRLKSEHATAAQGILDQMDRQRLQVEKLVGVIGNLGVTSGYLKTANQAKYAMWVWQGITVAAMGGLIVVAYKAFVPIVQGNFTWESFAGRVFLSLTVGVLAAYAATQADRLQETERRNRKLALELEALGPYLAPLPQDQQDKFRLEIGERSFGKEEAAIGRRGERSPATVIDILMRSKEFREFIVDIVRSARGG